MLQASKKSRMCWRCAVRASSASTGAGNVLSRQTLASRPALGVAGGRNTTTIRHASSAAMRALAGLPDIEHKAPIRERLRQWEKENPGEVESMLADHAMQGVASNTYTRPQNITMAQIDFTQPLFDGDELSDLRSEDALLQPGDLVELGSGESRRPALAICLGRFNGYEHFYTSAGKWFYGMGVKTLFVVRNFASPKEIEPIIKQLPLDNSTPQLLNALQDLGHGPARTVGAEMLRKMLDFVQIAEGIYQANAATLDASSVFIGDEKEHSYLTLHEIAERLLPPDMKRGESFTPVALYAVHRALIQDDVFFRPLKATGHRRSYLFEVSPLSEVVIVKNVEEMVRGYIQIAAITGNPTHQLRKKGAPPSLASFTRNARLAIDRSRENRQPTSCGILGPQRGGGAPEPVTWTETDREFLAFMELWCAYQKFPNFSRLQAVGSAILRAVDRYQDADLLDLSTGWTFLQECGVVSPWEIPARFTTRFPGVKINRLGGYDRPLPEGPLNNHLGKDVFEGFRKVWTGVTAFCIDAVTTVDIDDAVSVEKTDKPNEYWVHAHIADPASRILANTPMARYAELIPQTIYLPGSFERMLPEDIGTANFSLAPDRPCLTFSAKVNEFGDLLESKVTPGVLKNVVYITGEAVLAALGEKRGEPTVGSGEMSIGSSSKTEYTAERMMTTTPSRAQLKDLKLLSRLGKAMQEKRLQRGATPLFQPRAEVDVNLGDAAQSNAQGSVIANGDPSIKVLYKQRTDTDITENVMKMAGEVAAQWAHARGIPIPYRTQPHAVPNLSRIAQYTRDVFNPLLKKGIRPDNEHWRILHSLVGADELSTTAGPHWTLGVDMYTKATSPLRRYSDLIVHWQIEAALLHEMKQGKSLIGNKTQDSFLPFTKAQLDRLLPMVKLRERQARVLANGDGGDQWMLYALVRAWKFGEAPLPETFKFTVESIMGKRAVSGKLNWFDRHAILRIEGLNDVIRFVDVRIGDVLRVKLADVNVHANRVLVEAVNVIKSSANAEAAAIAAAQGSLGTARTIAV